MNKFHWVIVDKAETLKLIMDEEISSETGKLAVADMHDCEVYSLEDYTLGCIRGFITNNNLVLMKKIVDEFEEM